MEEDGMPEADSGGSSALRVLLEALEPQFRNIARGYRIAPSDAEDVLQNTLLRFARFREVIHSPGAWLAVTFRRECLRHLGRRNELGGGRVELESIDDLESAQPPLGPEARIHLAAAIERLPRRERRVLWQRFGLGLSLKELAEAMGWQVVTARKAVARALEILRGIYAGEESK
jgi:RNA polymerase sigma factor (sigma-70 family)